jgi:hypothetical protein
MGKNIILFALKNGVGSGVGSGSGSISQRYGSPDPDPLVRGTDPRQNVTDLQHCKKPGTGG